jgi:small-conductance mechanosensitive channel
VADDVDQHVEGALNTLVSITEKSGNLRNDLRNEILDSVSVLRKAFSKIKTHLENKNEENKKLSEEVKKTTQELDRMRDSRPASHVAPSMYHTQQTPRSGARQVLPSEGGRRKLFSEVLKGESNRRYKLSLKAKSDIQTVEQIKSKIKREINPTDIKVGIKAFKTMGDRGIVIETGSEEEINSLSSAIRAKFGEQLKLSNTN